MDAQLPRSLVRPLEQVGCDILHTLDLPDGNLSADNMISSIDDIAGRIVSCKDADVVRSHLLRGTPARLLLVATGNIGNQDLTALLLRSAGAEPDV
ncbi:DUF5615 family PIN-like protein [Synechococcus sp. CCY9202]|uniref:DUF5615 family PIN-like protein n=1 Tax=Synechococcus sp. CCY9202 TaxID=174698 RepID=UPI003A4C5890